MSEPLRLEGYRADRRAVLAAGGVLHAIDRGSACLAQQRIPRSRPDGWRHWEKLAPRGAAASSVGVAGDRRAYSHATISFFTVPNNGYSTGAGAARRRTLSDTPRSPSGLTSACGHVLVDGRSAGRDPLTGCSSQESSVPTATSALRSVGSTADAAAHRRPGRSRRRSADINDNDDSPTPSGR